MTKIKFQFHFQKTLQATGLILNLAGGEMDYLLFLKILYIAEREYLAEEGDMITGDRIMAMAYGPVLSNVYDLIKGKSEHFNWSDYVAKAKPYKIRLVKDPGMGDLSFAEKEKIKDVFNRYGNLSGFDVSEMTHLFPEWAGTYMPDAHKKAFPIGLEAILTAQAKTEMIDVAKATARQHEYYAKLFEGQE